MFCCHLSRCRHGGGCCANRTRLEWSTVRVPHRSTRLACRARHWTSSSRTRDDSTTAPRLTTTRRFETWTWDAAVMTTTVINLLLHLYVNNDNNSNVFAWDREACQHCHWGMHRETTLLFQCLSMALQRGNVVSYHHNKYHWMKRHCSHAHFLSQYSCLWLCAGGSIEIIIIYNLFGAETEQLSWLWHVTAGNCVECDI